MASLLERYHRDVYLCTRDPEIDEVGLHGTKHREKLHVDNTQNMN